MTVCVAVQVNDCIVFAADSASSLIGVGSAGQTEVTNVYDHGKKVFCLHKGLPIVAMTCGMGSLAGSSIEVIAKDFRGLLMGDDVDWHIDPKAYTIEDVAKKADAYFFEQYTAGGPIEAPHSFELYVGGFNTGSRLGEVWKIAIVNGERIPATVQAAPGECGVLWSGQPEAINRLVLGYGNGVIDALRDGGLPEEKVPDVVAAIRARTQASLTHPAMPVQDAIHLADFLVSVTIGYTKFLPGANTVGGATDIATVTRHEGFKWVRRKYYYPRELNPLETDHVGTR
jgi:hypothetical protein